MKKEIDLFKRDGFTETTSFEHEGHKVIFTQWESKCVNYYRHELEKAHRYIKHLERTVTDQIEIHKIMKKLEEKMLKESYEDKERD